MSKKKFEKFDFSAQPFTPGGANTRPQQGFGLNNTFHSKKPMSLQDYQNQRSGSNTSAKSFGAGAGASANVSDFETSSGASSRLTTPSQSSTSLTALNQSMEKLQVSPLSELLKQLRECNNLADIRKVSGEISALVADNLDKVPEWDLLKFLELAATSKNSTPLIKEATMVLVQTLANDAMNDKSPYDAYLCEMIPICLNLASSKEATVIKSAQKAADLAYSAINPLALPSVLLPELCRYLSSSAKWKSKIAALKLVSKLIEDSNADTLKLKFHDTVPVLADTSSDFKPELAREGLKVLAKFVNVLSDNLDLEKNLPIIVTALNDPKKVTECVKALASTTFVTEVTEPTLAVLSPTLNKSLMSSQSSQDQLRLTVAIVENLTRLVSNYREIARYTPILLPSVTKIAESATLPEVRELASKSLVVLHKADEYSKTAKNEDFMTVEKAEKLVKASNSTTKSYLANVLADASNSGIWSELTTFFDKLSQPDVVSKVQQMLKVEIKTDEDDEEGEELVNTEFSLAYGGRMLLSKTKLRLLKGHRYGLCGRNGAGKSTLMRAINNGQVDGFPSSDVLRTCFVEHKVPEDNDRSNNYDLVKLIMSEPGFEQLSKQEVENALESVGFDEQRRSQALNSLSGGWRMKLELAKAMLLKADVLLLDEPTNHLDVTNVAWLQQYLLDHTEITSLIVSHDSGFLDTVCTNIIHYESKKLVYYKGNLAALVAVKPEAKSYYELTDSNAQMHFPRCGLLQGIKSRTKAVARMADVTFSYPGTNKISLSHVSCSLSLSSRVAIVGPNGAGKSTLVKLLTGELVPDFGQVQKHPNLRVGYIAQHALQHVEQHKEKTALQYLQWRYRFGDDREVLLKESRQISDEEKKIMEQEIDIGDGRGKRQIEAIVGRQKHKKSFQYEVKWRYWLPKYNSFVPKEVLVEHGFDKLVQRFDDHEASREGLGYRELLVGEIRKHFEDVGLDGDIAEHTALGSLSGGQLVKVVIAGAMWNNPHLLVLDEPTNYLDRDSLGALAAAINEWNGGVIMISHNSEFTKAVCPEEWHVENGQLKISGEAGQAPSTETSPADIKVRQRKKKLTRNEKKARDERRRLRHIEWLSSPKGTPKPEDTDSD